MHPENPRPTLVLGATGKTGRRVARRLEDLGLEVRRGSRTGNPRFDWLDRTTWTPALNGVGAVYITYQPDLSVPGAVDAIRDFAAAALAAGPKRLVLLSGRGEPEAEQAEQALQDSGADWTIVRASWFAQNFSEDFLLDAVRSGEVTLPIRDVGEPFIDIGDIAEVVVAALTDRKHIGQLYEVTGPRLMTIADTVAEIAAAADRNIRFTRIPLDDYAAMLKNLGVPSDHVSLVTYLFGTIMDGRNEFLTDGVQRALGRPPRDFSDYARATAATGIWNNTDQATA